MESKKGKGRFGGGGGMPSFDQYSATEAAHKFPEADVVHTELL